MAEEKKALPIPTLTFGRMFVDFIILLFIIFVLARLVSSVYAFLTSFFTNRGYVGSSAESANFWSGIYYGLQSAFLYSVIALNIFCVLLLMGIIYSLVRLREINKAELAALNAAPAGKAEEGAAPEHESWNRVIDLVNSDNPSDWRLSIIESDIILDGLLTKIGCVGSTVGEKLKQVEKSDFLTLDQAWAAHRVRNDIAHEQGFDLNSREAKRVISLYEEVFTEFNII